MGGNRTFRIRLRRLCGPAVVDRIPVYRLILSKDSHLVMPMQSL